jgi:cell division protein FtsI (penicillin-binding protein 3)
MAAVRESKARLVWTVILLAVGFGVLLSRLVFLQIVNAQDLSSRAERQREKGVDIEAQRGTIFDRRGGVLATNVEVPSLYAVPAMIRDPRATASALSRRLGVDRAAVLERLRSDRSFVWIKRKVDPAAAKGIEKLGLDGLGFLTESQRFYPKRYLLGQVLGFAGIDNQGLEGLERKYDRYLRGEKRTLVLEHDAKGNPIFQKGLDYSGLAPGRDLVLTIDEVIQHVAERELDEAMEKSRAENGSVIVMDPRTGEILAMAVRPAFNPNNLNGYDPDQWRTRTVTDVYEPGSTFKLVVAAAALEENRVDPGDVIFCENGALRVGGAVIHDHLKYGDLTFSQVIQKSSNIGTAKVAMRLGPDTVFQYARKFGFSEKSGIDLLGEVPGVVRDPDEWSGRSLVSVAIGQEVAVTPLQLATAYSAVANGGVLLKPYLVSEIRNPDGGRVAKFEPEVRRRVLRTETARRLTEILEGVVEEGGTAEEALLSDYTVAGKTGTAQKIDPDTGRYSPNQYVTSFVGYAPAEEPRITVLVVLDSPKGEAWGGTVAAPVFRRVAEQTLHYLGVPPRTPKEMVLAKQ